MSTFSHIAVVASESFLLEAFLEQLAEINESIQLDLLAVHSDAQSGFFAGRSVAFQAMEDYDFSACDACLVLEQGIAAQALAPLLEKSSCSVFAWQADSQAFAALDQSRLSYITDPYIAALRLLSEVFASLGVEFERVDLTALLPASLYGKAGVAELASQTAKLLNGQAVESAVFPGQMTFNYGLLSQSAIGADYQQGLQQELSAAFSSIDTTLQALQMPVFHGAGALLRLELSKEFEREAFLQAVSAQEGVRYVEDGEQASGLAFANADTELLLGSLDMDLDDKHHLSCFLGFDEVKFAAAVCWLSKLS